MPRATASCRMASSDGVRWSATIREGRVARQLGPRGRPRGSPIRSHPALLAAHSPGLHNSLHTNNWQRTISPPCLTLTSALLGERSAYP